MHERVVGLYVHQQQRVYTRKETEVIINGRGKATPVQLTALRPPFKFSRSAAANHWLDSNIFDVSGQRSFSRGGHAGNSKIKLFKMFHLAVIQKFDIQKFPRIRYGSRSVHALIGIRFHWYTVKWWVLNAQYISSLDQYHVDYLAMESAGDIHGNEIFRKRFSYFCLSVFRCLHGAISMCWELGRTQKSSLANQRYTCSKVTQILTELRKTVE